VPTHDSLEAASAAMRSALDAYEAWLTRAWFGALPDAGCTSGASLLAAVGRLRHQWFPDTSLLMSELLVVHVDLTTILYDFQLRAIRGGGRTRPLSDAPARTLIEKQIAAIGRMRRACCLGDGPAPGFAPSKSL
jgi:hypothetical protein